MPQHRELPLRRRTRTISSLPTPAPRLQPADQIAQRRQGVVVIVHRRFGLLVGGGVAVSVEFRFVQELRTAVLQDLEPAGFDAGRELVKFVTSRYFER